MSPRTTAPPGERESAIELAYEAAKSKPRRAGWALDLVCQQELTPDTTAPLRTGRGQWKLVRFAARNLRPFWVPMTFVILCVLVLGIFGTLAVWPLSLVVDYALPDRDWTMFWIAIAIGWTVWLILSPGIIFRWPSIIAETLRIYLAAMVRTRLRIHFVRHLHRLSLRFLQRRPVGEHMYRAISDVDSVIDLITVRLPGIITAVLNFVWLIFLVGLIVNRSVVVAVFLYMIPFMAIYHLVASWIRRVDRKVRAREQQVSAVLQEGVAGVQTVKAFGRQSHELRKFMNRHCEMYRQRTLLGWVQSLQIFLFGFILTPGILPWFKSQALIAWGYYLVVTGELTYGKAILLTFWVDALTGPLASIVDDVQRIRALLIPLERVFETMSIEPMVKDAPGAPEAPPIRGDLEFENVDFSYVPGKQVLRELSFRIRAGETVGIVGPSGAGKSTLVRLALRLYDPDSGAVRVDGSDLRSVKAESVQDQVGIVFQETYLFEGTIRDQLLFSNPAASEAELREAIEGADLTEFIESLPQKWDTNLAEGTRLSGGQKQRIGIARALVRKPKLMLLDEPTASLDSATEAEVMRTLYGVMRGRTSVIISHRLALVRPLDRIVVIDNGRVVEEGRHDELLENDGLYAELWREQYGPLREEEA